MNHKIIKIKGVLLIILIFLLTLSLFSCEKDKKEVIITGESTVYVGSKIYLQADTKNVEGEVTWISSDESIATVSDGEVIGLKAGLVTITAKVEEVKGEIEIEVMEVVKEDVTLFCGINIINDEMVVHKKVELAIAEREAGYIINNYDPYDYNKISVLMSFYKKAYRIIGLVVALLGIVLLPFLPYLISGANNFDMNTIYIIYVLYLINTVSTYFISYKETLITANQKKYLLVKIE